MAVWSQYTSRRNSDFQQVVQAKKVYRRLPYASHWQEFPREIRLLNRMADIEICSSEFDRKVLREGYRRDLNNCGFDLGRTTLIADASSVFLR
jgi:hypothetical protein